MSSGELTEYVRHVERRHLSRRTQISREWSIELLRHDSGLPEKELLTRLSRLKDSEFLYERGIYPETSYTFKHALTQEVAYNSLLVKKRKEIHEKIGRAMERTYEERLEEFYEMLAYHYSRSDNLEKAHLYLTLSGCRAAKNYSNWEAIRFYKEAIQVLDSQPEGEERKGEKIKVCLAIQRPMALLSYPEGSLEILEDAERLSKEVGDEKTLARVYGRLGVYHSAKGNPTLGLEYSLRGMEYSEKSFNDAEKIEAIDSIVGSAFQVCNAHNFTGDYVKLVDIAGRAIKLLEEHHKQKDIVIGASNLYLQLTGLCGAALGYLGKFEEGKAKWGMSLRISLKRKRDSE